MRSRLSPGNDGGVQEGYSAPDLSLYVIADCAIARRPVPEIVEAALAGGATAVQLRWKTGTDRQILAVGEALRLITRRAGVPLIVNDRVDLALALEGDGVHLGPDDLPVRLARKLLGGGCRSRGCRLPGRRSLSCHDHQRRRGGAARTGGAGPGGPRGTHTGDRHRGSGG